MFLVGHIKIIKEFFIEKKYILFLVNIPRICYLGSIIYDLTNIDNLVNEFFIDQTLLILHHVPFTLIVSVKIHKSLAKVFSFFLVIDTKFPLFDNSIVSRITDS